MSTYLKARLGLVIVEYIQKPEEKVGEIVLTGELNRELREAIVVSVGPGFNNLEPIEDLKIGDKVLVRYQSNVSPPSQPGRVTQPVYRTIGTPLVDREKNKTFYMHNQSDIVAIIVESPTKLHA